MFLVVFVTLVVSVIALFGQVLTLQTARINAAQVGLMQIMAAWNGAAIFGIKNNPPTNMGTLLTGCSLIADPLFSTCTPSTLTNYLPPGYNTSRFSFYSVAFQAGIPAITYVVTYVQPPTTYTPAAPANSDLYLPAVYVPTQLGFDSGYNMVSLSRQFAHGASGYLAYGSVTSPGILTIIQKADGSGAIPPGTNYSIPPTIPVGSLGIISVAQ